MLHLAQVKKNPTSGEMQLQLLAHQHSWECWQVSNREVVSCEEVQLLNEGLLVLVELDHQQKISKIQEATDWVVNLVLTYLSGQVMTPEWVEKEQEKIEQWRQEITAKSLDLTRRYLELEAHKEQIQELEINLKKEKEGLENRRQALEELEAKLQKMEEK